VVSGSGCARCGTGKWANTPTQCVSCTNPN
jgi:hypothetical protein